MDQDRASRILAAEAIVGITFGLLLLVVPDRLLAIYGVKASDGVILLGRLLGAELLGFNYANVVAIRGDRRSLSPVVRGHLVGNGVGFLVALGAVIAGTVNGAAWSIVLIFLLFALAYGWVLIARPRRFP